MTRRGWWLFTVMCVVWGIPYLMIKIAVGSVSVPVLVFTRTAGGAVVLLPLAARLGGLRALCRHWRPLAAFAAAEVIGPWWLLSDAERRLPSAFTGLLIAAVPIIGVVLARLTGGAERLGLLRWSGLVLGFAGVAVLAVPSLHGGNGWSLVEMLLVAVGYAAAPIIAARRLAGVPSLPMTAACLALAAFVYAPAAVATWPRELPAAQALGALAGLVVVCTALAFVVFFELIREVGVSRAMVFTYLNPVVAVAAGVVLLGEPLTVSIALSFLLIIVGSLLAAVPRPRS
ncbi:MAG: DMT family transporter [Kutzneria sp.]|nr:DMT family transporter [Kutzneria sp.]MBV9846199.1 DMT family transporter [Kutzneria sp.]